MKLNRLAGEKELREFIRILPYIFVGNDEPFEELVDPSNQLVMDLEENRIDWNQARDRFNEIFGNEWEALWWGPFKDLLVSDLKEPRRFVKDFGRISEMKTTKARMQEKTTDRYRLRWKMNLQNG